MRYHLFKTVCLLFLVSCSFAEGELIVFVSNNGSEVDSSFQTNTLPKIKQFAKENDISFQVKSAKDGLPRGITTLPAIVYQNSLGRSVFIGRYNQVDKIVNFVRTSKRIPQTKSEYKTTIVQRGWTLQDGKSKVEVKMKVTDLAGVKPKKFNAVQFAMQSEIDVVSAMQQFKESQNFSVAPTDRKFYANFYPFLADDGNFYVTTELYSQFHCHEPIYTTLGKPFSGTWKKKEEVFAAAAQDIEKQIQKHSKSSKNGDGFDPVPKEVSEKTWDELGCGLPLETVGTKKITADITLPQNWKVKGPVSELDPLVAFSFPPPVDNYSGEVKKLDGMLSLKDDLKLAHAKGEFGVSMHSLTMGEPDLDESVKAEDMLNVNNYPGARFSFDGLYPLEDQPLTFGIMQTATCQGRFTFMGITTDQVVNAQITPLIDEDGYPVLEVSASFSINILKPFGIQGPDGPEPQKNTVKFMLNFLMEEQ